MVVSKRQQSVGDVTISGGIIDAKSDRGAAIGGGQQATGDSNIIISGGDITVASDFGENLLGNSTGEPAGAKISGGTFNVAVSDYCEDGFSPKLVNGKYVVDDSADTLNLFFKQHSDDKTVYDIVLNGDGKDINRLNAAEFTFKLTTTDAITYEIAAAEKMALIPQENEKYEFHFDGKDAVADTGADITIGTVKFDGYGAFTFEVTDGRVTATTTSDNLVTEFVTTATTGKGTLVIDAPESIINDTITIPSHTLTVNVLMNHSIGDNAADYQNMTVAISGGDLAGQVLTYNLGDADNAAITKVTNANGKVISYQVKAELRENRLYTVTVTGAGYRTARYTVTMNDNKTMNVWNNAMSEDTVVVDKTKAMTNFLAGDIVKDGNVNIYDLSAVVAYFGTDNQVTDHPTYAKYDLNRDGVIDMMDISIVLTSWGK